jgi:ABC-type cobalamin/Fe3+-siderophores transport system ATPase subunit
MIESPIMEVHGLGFSYPSGAVLQDLDLTIRPGRFYTIVGPNGSGKTTLLDVLCGNKYPSTGTVHLNNRPLADYRRRELARNLALVPQEFGIEFPFTVREVVAMGRHPHIPRFSRPSSEDVQAVNNALAAMDLDRYAATYVTQLSGGEKQRVVLARAMAQDTPVLLLDEPVSHLDIRHSLMVLGFAKALAAQGRIVIAVMHDLNLAALTGEEFLFLNQGRIEAAGPGPEVLTPENIARVFGVKAAVEWNDFSQAYAVSYRSEDPNA